MTDTQSTPQTALFKNSSDGPKYPYFLVDASSGQPIAWPIYIVDGSGNPISSFGGGTQYTDGGTPPTHPVGTELVFNNAGTWTAVSNTIGLPISGNQSGTLVSITLDASSNLNVNQVAGASLYVDAASVPTHPTGNALVYKNGSSWSVVSGANALPVGGTMTVNQTTASQLNGIMTIEAVTGTALAADQSNTELRVSTYVKKSAAGDTALALGQATMANSLPFTLASDQSNVPTNIAAITSALSQSNQVPVSNAAPQGKLTLSGTLTANSDNSITFSGGATVARRIRIQNESAGVIYWETDTTASAGSPSLAAPAANAVSVEWIAVQCTTLHIFIPTGGTTTLNGSGGVKVTAYA